MNDKISKLILLYVPTNVCNFKCDYCFISHTDNWDNKINFKYNPDQILAGLTKKRLGGTCLVNITANGETLLYKDLVLVTKGLLEEGHYVEIVTNGTVKQRVNELLELPKELLKRLFFKISYHYEQLIKNEMVYQQFWINVKAIKQSPCSFSLEVMPNDKLVPSLHKLCEDCKSNAGAVCHATVGRDDAVESKKLLTNMTHNEYVGIWNSLDSEMFYFKMRLFGVRRKEFCYAGKWSLLINLANGEAMQCYGRPTNQNIFDDPTKKIKFIPVGYSCMQPFCFNGHSHLAFGMIPKLETPRYSEVRNRICIDGSLWLKPNVKLFFDQKLYENNKEYSLIKKIVFTVVNPFYLFIVLFNDISETRRKARKFIYIVSGKYKKARKNNT